jgi:hypothetical protein
MACLDTIQPFERTIAERMGLYKEAGLPSDAAVNLGRTGRRNRTLLACHRKLNDTRRAE